MSIFKLNTNQIVSVTDVMKNFKRVAHKTKENEKTFIFTKNKAEFVLVTIEVYEQYLMAQQQCGKEENK